MRLTAPPLRVSYRPMTTVALWFEVRARRTTVALWFEVRERRTTVAVWLAEPARMPTVTMSLLRAFIPVSSLVVGFRNAAPQGFRVGRYDREGDAGRLAAEIRQARGRLTAPARVHQFDPGPGPMGRRSPSTVGHSGTV